MNPAITVRAAAALLAPPVTHHASVTHVSIVIYQSRKPTIGIQSLHIAQTYIL